MQSILPLMGLRCSNHHFERLNVILAPRFCLIIQTIWTGFFYYAIVLFSNKRAVNSAGECHVDIVEVVGSNPISPKRQLV